MNEVKIQLNSVLNEQDYKRASYFNAFLYRPFFSILIVIVFLIGVISLLFPNLMKLSIIFSILFVIYPFFLFFMTASRIQKIVQKKKQANDGEQTVTISEEQITCTKKTVNEACSWGQINHLYETPNYFFIYTASNKIFIFPKRDITAEELQQIRNIVINQLSYKKYRLKNN